MVLSNGGKKPDRGRGDARGGGTFISGDFRAGESLSVQRKGDQSVGHRKNLKGKGGIQTRLRSERGGSNYEQSRTRVKV